MSEFGDAGDRATDARLRRDGEALRAQRSACPPPELLLARRSDVLDAGLRDRLDAHVSTCAACRRLADDLDSLGLSEPDESVEQQVLSRIGGRARGGRSAVWSLAAAALLVSVLGVTWWRSRVDSPGVPAPVARQTPEIAAPSSPPVVALWSIAPAPVRVPLSSLGVPRGGAGSNPDGALLVAALAPYQLGDYGSAIARLSPIVRDFPESGEAHFYLGVSHLLAGQPVEAVASLDRAVQHLPAGRQTEAEWYLATAEQRADLVDRARARLRTLCARPGEHRAQACAAEASLK